MTAVRAGGPCRSSLGYTSSVTAVSAYSALTADTAVDAVAAAVLAPPPPLTNEVEDAEVAALRRMAAAAAMGGRHREATELYRDLLEARPSDEDALNQLFASLPHVQAPGKGPQLRGNHSDAFRAAMEANLAAGTAELVSRDPPAYVLHNVLTADEARTLLATRERLRDKWSAAAPLVCFNHATFQRDARLRPYMRHGLGASGTRSCLNASASSAVVAARAVRWSESLAVYRGQDALVDEVTQRLEARAGLRDSSGQHVQLLAYDRDSSYHAHTDCTASEDLLSSPRTRMASALVYLSADDFEGGATEFTRPNSGNGGGNAPLAVRPAVGSALLFYSYGPHFGSRTCSRNSEHRAAPVRSGVKHVLQRWYAYREDPFFDFRPWRSPGAEALRAPWQPVVQCDRLDQVPQRHFDVSCRWYNVPDTFVFEDADGSGAMRRLG